MPAKLEEIGLLRPDTVQCPYPYYKRTRETAPVHFMPDPNTLLVSSYDLCREVLKDAKAYANKIGVASPNRREKAEAIIAEKGYGRFLPTIVNNDPPAHGYFRKLFDRAFRASCIRRMFFTCCSAVSCGPDVCFIFAPSMGYDEPEILLKQKPSNVPQALTGNSDVLHG